MTSILRIEFPIDLDWEKREGLDDPAYHLAHSLAGMSAQEVIDYCVPDPETVRCEIDVDYGFGAVLVPVQLEGE